MAKCDHCRKRKATATWDLTACAATVAITARFCAECDAQLNEDTLRFVNHPDTDKLMKAYRERERNDP